MENKEDVVSQEDHVIATRDEQKVRIHVDRLKLMHHKISNPPKLLTKSAAKSSCCIFRVPQSYIEINGKSYQPQIVSIGPYHRGEPHLSMIEEHKWSYLGIMLDRTRLNGLQLEDLLEAVHSVENKARECYSETIHLDSDEFIEMMVLDGCFIIEVFRKVGDVVRFEEDDPIVTMSWVIFFLQRDLLKLENQIPYFVLERLFILTRMPEEEESASPGLSRLALEFFNYTFQRPGQIIARQSNLKGKHLLDLIRSSYIEFEQGQPMGAPMETHVIASVSKLRRAGIQLVQGKADSFLTVEFKNGIIEMPGITIDDMMCSFLLNCVAYEQCHATCSKHFTTYATFLDYLVNTQRDVEYLSDRNIIENYLGTDAEVAHFINNLGKDVAFDIHLCYLSKLLNEVHQYYQSSWHMHLASFKYTYFNTPWSFISALAALILLLLTVAQTFYTIYSVYK